MNPGSFAEQMQQRRIGKYLHTVATLEDMIFDLEGMVPLRADEATLAEFEALPFVATPGGIHRDEALMLYLVVRSLKPAAVLETGTYRGTSTTFIASALKHNGSGVVVDIDREAGRDIPQELREQVVLIRGRASTAAFAEIADRWPQFDLFFHDSRHTYGNVRTELQLFSPLVCTGGIIICHDAKMDHVKGFGVGRACREVVAETGWQLRLLDTTCGLAVLKTNGRFPHQRRLLGARLFEVAAAAKRGMSLLFGR